MYVGRGWLRIWRRRFQARTTWRTAKEVLAEAEAPFRNGGEFEEAGSTEYESEEKIVGQEFCFAQRIQLAASTQHARGFDGRRRDEAAAKNEGSERYDEEN